MSPVILPAGVLEELLALRAEFRIVHHVPGRLRIRFTARALNRATRDDARHLATGKTPPAGVKCIRVNALARSIIIEYDTNQIPVWTWRDLVEGSTEEATAAFNALITNK